ncbi:radical SAM protein [bacterium]|nr:radical SAM protein [bacterium]
MKCWATDFSKVGRRAADGWPVREKRSRLLAGEIYIPPAPYDPHAGSVRALLVYPNTYHVGMSNLGFLYLYRLLNERPEIACERAFYEEGLKTQSFETGSGILSFDVILFTLPFEMDALQILRFLKETGIPPLASDRTDKTWPLVVIGGAAPSLNPRFLLPFADAVFAGDVEPVFDQLVSVFADIRREPRRAVVERLEEIPGVATAARVAAGAPIPKPEISTPRGCFNTVATPHTEFARSLLVEIERGCPFRCRFCTVGFERRRLTEMPPAEVEKLVRSAEEHGLRFGMIGSALLSSKLWKTERQVFEESSVDFTFASLRADKLHAGNLRSLSKFQKSLTLAPEVGTMRMMRLINKRMDLAAAREKLAQAKAGGIRKVKLYFIYGFPFETEPDIRGIVDFCADAVKLGLKVRASLNPFIPKPQTPLQWFPMEPLAVLKSKFRYLRNALRAAKVHDVSGYSPREAVQQAFLIHAWESAAPAILAMAYGKGSVSGYRGIGVSGNTKGHRYAGTPILRYSPAEALPWDILQTAVSKSSLEAEAREILEACKTESMILNSPAQGD